MTLDVRKVCLVGEPGTGKTQLVRALLGDAAVPPVRGVWANPVPVEGGVLRLWDIAGATALDSLNQAFLSGIEGVIAMADAARPATAATALGLIAQVRRLYPGTPAVLLLNRRGDDAAPAMAPEPAVDVEVFEVDALRGDGVQAALAALARRLSASAAGRP